MQPGRCGRCGTKNRLLKPKEGLPTYCYACWKAKDVPLRVTVIETVPRPPISRRIRSKSEVRAIGIMRSVGGKQAEKHFQDGLGQRKRKARRRAK